MIFSSAAPARLFVRGGALGEGIEWAFWLGALVWWIDDLSLSPLQLVFMGTALEATILFAETPTGVIADRFSRKWSIVLAHALMGLSFAWAVASRDFWVIFPAQILLGISWTLKSGADVAWVTDEVRGVDPANGDDDAIEQLILRRHRFGIAAAIGCVLLMMLIGAQSVRLAMVVTGLAKVAQALWYAVAMTEEYFTPQRETGAFRDTLTEGVAVVKRTRTLQILMATVVLMDICGEVLDRFAFKRFIDALGAEQESIIATGVLFLVLAVAGIIVNSLVSRDLVRRQSTSDPAKPGQATGVVTIAIVLLVIAAVGTLVIALTAVPVAIGVGLMLQDATRESLDPVISSWTNRETPSSVRATVHSLIGQASAIGGITGGLVLGAIAEQAGIPSTLLITTALIVVAAGVASRSRKPALNP